MQNFIHTILNNNLFWYLLWKKILDMLQHCLHFWKLKLRIIGRFYFDCGESRIYLYILASIYSMTQVNWLAHFIPQWWHGLNPLYALSHDIDCNWPVCRIFPSTCMFVLSRLFAFLHVYMCCLQNSFDHKIKNFLQSSRVMTLAHTIFSLEIAGTSDDEYPGSKA